MASKVYLIYKTDNQHSYQSRDLLAVVIDHNPIPFIKTHALKTGDFISEDDQYNLVNIKQTQNFEGKGEYMYELVEANVLL